MVVGHNHEHLVFGEGHQATEDASGLSHSAVETFGALVLTDHQARNQTGLTPVVQLRQGWTIIIITEMRGQCSSLKSSCNFLKSHSKVEKISVHQLVDSDLLWSQTCFVQVIDRFLFKIK